LYIPVGAWLISLTKYGYVVAVADPRGVGASYGTRGASWDTQEAEDTHDLIEWLGTQPWGQRQCRYVAVSPTWCGIRGVGLLPLNTPHLKAISLVKRVRPVR
jgi:predicted acyl esterase